MSLQDFNIYIINYWLLIPTVLFLLLLSFLEKRKCQQDVCDGRPALITPFSFLDGFDNRAAYAMAFGTITNTIVSLITSARTTGITLPLWGRALYSYIEAFIGCVTCFPLFACLSTRYRALGAIICICYSAILLNLNIVNTVKQVKESGNNSEWIKALYIPQSLVILELTRAYALLQGIPPIFCYVLLIGICINVLRRCVLSGVYLDDTIPGTAKPHQALHVKWVFRKSKDETLKKGSFISNKTFVELMCESSKLKFFTNFPFFKYPTRIVAGVFVLVIIIYWLGILLICGTIQILHSFFIVLNAISKFIEIDYEDLSAMNVIASVSLAVSISNSLAHIFVAMRNYRYHMLKIYQGDKSFLLSVTSASPQYVMTSSMIYPGYQIAFMMWGMVISFAFTLVTGLVVNEAIGLIILLGQADKALRLLGQLIVFPITLVLLFYVQVFISENLFLQDRLNYHDRYKPLNVNNRKLYELVSYYSMFANMAVGLFTCFFRIALNALFGIFFVDRLDTSVFTRDMEHLDSGHLAYVSMLLVDNAHNNPCMRVFTHLLWTRALAARFKLRQQTEPGCRDETGPSACGSQVENCWIAAGAAETTVDGQNGAGGYGSNMMFCDIKNFAVSTPAKIRWFLAYTLLHNPQLLRLRKHACSQLQDGTLKTGIESRLELSSAQSEPHSNVGVF